MSMMAKKTTLLDVARLAKVSLATVSRVANGHPRVDADIQTRVLAAARQLDLDLGKTKKSRTIAFVLGNCEFPNEFQARLLLGVEDYCGQNGWDLQFLSFRCELWPPNDELQLPQVLARASRPDGVVLGGVHTAGMLQALRSARIPFSVLGNNLVGDWNPEEFDAVFSDDRRGATEITEYLIGQGHREICFIGDERLPWYARCGEAFRTTMHAAALQPLVSEIRSNDRELGYLAAKSLLASRGSLSAVFAGNDQTAAGVYRAFQEFGVRVPEDISVVGFNDTLGSILFPGLTTSREFPEEQGRHLAEFVLRRIQEPGLPPQQMLIPTQLIRRDSVRNVATLPPAAFSDASLAKVLERA